MTQDAIDEQAREILELTHKVENARNTHRDEVRNENEDELEHGQLIHDAVCQGTVLLKNDGDILPLERGMTSRIALLGLSEEHPRHEGIAAPNNSYARVTPLQPLQNAIGNSTELIYQGKRYQQPSFLPQLTNRKGHRTFPLFLHYGKVYWTYTVIPDSVYSTILPGISEACLIGRTVFMKRDIFRLERNGQPQHFTANTIRLLPGRITSQ